MFPILPLLILFLLGPANAERLAVEGRLPAALLAVHRSMVVPVCATVVAPLEETDGQTATHPSGPRPSVGIVVPIPTTSFASIVVLPSCPARAGP